MPARIDLTGQRFGRLICQKIVGRTEYKKVIWECLCDCGKTCTANANHLRTGARVSCGCVNDERRKAGTSSFRHGHYRNGQGTPTHESWTAMMTRCTNPKVHEWRHYGGRGILVCDRWTDFRNFLADMGERPKDHTLDRIDPNGNYEPGNCRWATHQQQALNKRNSKHLWVFGRVRHTRELCNEYGMDRKTFKKRLDAGMTAEEAITAKPGNRWHGPAHAPRTKQ